MHQSVTVSDFQGQVISGIARSQHWFRAITAARRSKRETCI